MVAKKKEVKIKESKEETIEECSEDERVCKPKEDSKITKLDDLPGIGPVTIDKLKEQGFEDLMSIAVASAGVLSDVAGITETTANKAISAARDAMELGFSTAEEVSNKRKSITKITIGSEEVDKLIEDGEVHFQMCGLKSRFLDDGDTDGPDEDEIMNIRTPEIKGLSSKNYIW